jgi:ectoine hydroxylase-related dioxygenase (phytanoyl-CoA dioxygenase family)
MVYSPPSPDPPLRDLTAAEIASYDRDGVLFARGLFQQSWIERMAAALDHAVANPTDYGNTVSLRDQGFSGDLFLWKEHDDFRDFIYESPASHIAARLLRSKRVNFFYDQLFVKPAGCHVATPWHQDVTFWPVAGEQLCSMWLTFDPVSRESSGLEFVRGSHTWPSRYKAVTPDYNPYMMDSDLEDPPDIDAHREDFDLVSWDMEPGDVLLFNARVLHGSTGNHTTDRPRRAFASRWGGDDVRYEPRHATMPLFWRHDLLPGDRLGGPLFPRILPEPIAAEGARRSEGPEPQDPDVTEAVIEQIQTGMKARREAAGAAAGS